MEPFLPHIVIAEHEFLIALDAEFLIKRALDCRITLLRPEQLDQWDEAALSGIDLCLFDVPLDASHVRARIERLIDARVPLLFTTVGGIDVSGVEGFEVIPVAKKPYDGEAIMTLIKGRLRQMPQPPEAIDQN
ncbi:hypothetical protein [Sinorhizobium sp. RAC02]|uniref:hypothetical protein n=1 Tax=Sinorhizobium sp. RAC02 TaxID=1842534 RepID=UPI00083DCEE7|nr:hypothetical protein [Sinorhizobium sp. RAC02]AOF89080.1 hypothetical protein BSY16_2959 [Sinorhizobium sp. RAC02]